MEVFSLYLKDGKFLSKLTEVLNIYTINNKDLAFVVFLNDKAVFTSKNLDNEDHQCKCSKKVSIFFNNDNEEIKSQYLIDLTSEGLPKTVFALIDETSINFNDLNYLLKNSLFENFKSYLLDPFNEINNRELCSLPKISFNEVFNDKRQLIIVKRNYFLFLEGMLKTFKSLKPDKSLKDYFAKMFISFQEKKNLDIIERLFYARFTFDEKTINVYIHEMSDVSRLLVIFNFLKNLISVE